MKCSSWITIASLLRSMPGLLAAGVGQRLRHQRRAAGTSPTPATRRASRPAPASRLAREHRQHAARGDAPELAVHAEVGAARRAAGERVVPGQRVRLRGARSRPRAASDDRAADDARSRSRSRHSREHAAASARAAHTAPTPAAMQIVGSAGIQCFSAPKIGVEPSKNGPIDAAAESTSSSAGARVRSALAPRSARSTRRRRRPRPPSVATGTVNSVVTSATCHGNARRVPVVRRGTRSCSARGQVEREPRRATCAIGSSHSHGHSTNSDERPEHRERRPATRQRWSAISARQRRARATRRRGSARRARTAAAARCAWSRARARTRRRPATATCGRRGSASTRRPSRTTAS